MSLFGRRRRKSTRSIFFATDLHGSEKCFGKFLNAAGFYGVDALVLGGDLSGKIVVPIVQQEDGTHKTRFLDQDLVLSDEAAAVEAERRIRLNGYYPFRCTRAELDVISADDGRREERIREVVRADLERWMAKADEKLGASGVPCAGIPGNDDDDFVGTVLDASERVVNCEDQVVVLDGFQVLGLGYSNPTPWNSPRELSEDALAERIERAAANLQGDLPTIFNLHVPPHNTGLDMAAELDEDLAIAGGRQVPVGSTAVAEAIERFQPVLSLHGHVHESRGAFKIWRSLCLNPGSEYNVGVLRGVIVRLDETNAVVGHQFVAA